MTHPELKKIECQVFTCLCPMTGRWENISNPSGWALAGPGPMRASVHSCPKYLMPKAQPCRMSIPPASLMNASNLFDTHPNLPFMHSLQWEV